MQWTPLLSSPGPDRDAAWEAVEAISQAILDKNYEQKLRAHRPEEEALLYAYRAAASGDEMWATRAEAALNEAVDVPERTWLGLYGGVSGLGWAMTHVSDLIGDQAEPSPLLAESAGDGEDGDAAADIDRGLFRALRAMRESGRRPVEYDLIGGLVGYGVYFLERWPRETSREGLSLVIDRLDAMATRVGAGITWHTDGALLPDWQRQREPDGYYNLGVAHGVPGIIHVLSEAAARNVEVERANALLDGAMAWLMAQRRPVSSRSWFSSWVGSGESQDSRLTWCYGDLGILAVLNQAARRCGRAEWRRFADELLEFSLARSMTGAGIEDAALCHGAIGTAQVFSRLYQTGGDPRCREAALLWLDRALKMRQPDSGVGGFSIFLLNDPGVPGEWYASPSFLDGAIGIALALLGALVPVEPKWDRLLLLSAAEPGRTD